MIYNSTRKHTDTSLRNIQCSRSWNRDNFVVTFEHITSGVVLLVLPPVSLYCLTVVIKLPSLALIELLLASLLKRSWNVWAFLRRIHFDDLSRFYWRCSIDRIVLTEEDRSSELVDHCLIVPMVRTISRGASYSRSRNGRTNGWLLSRNYWVILFVFFGLTKVHFLTESIMECSSQVPYTDTLWWMSGKRYFYKHYNYCRGWESAL